MKKNIENVRKHTVKRSNSGDQINAEKLANKPKPINSHGNATSAKDSSNLSESTIQAFQDAMHFKPLSHTHRSNDTPVTILSEKAISNDDPNQINLNNIHVDDDDDGNTETGCRSHFQGISLKDFEKHQQIMKEANLEKRRLLSKAIEQR